MALNTSFTVGRCLIPMEVEMDFSKNDPIFVVFITVSSLVISGLLQVSSAQETSAGYFELTTLYNPRLCILLPLLFISIV